LALNQFKDCRAGQADDADHEKFQTTSGSELP